ncbi:MAG: hypothetical protein LHW59_11985, partial [Candidatus Cloacimonetes bacterium]|nr:hypothetical protein [Candidatus Cloacimonadota bacterium]
MNSKYLLTIILTAFVIVGLYHIFAVSRFNYPEYQLKEGQVAETEIIAPFDFPVLKSAQQLSNEQEESIRSLSMPYRISDEPLFDALSTMDIIWAVFFRFPDLERADLQKEFEKAGFPLTVESLKFAMDSNARDRVYDDLRLALTEIYNQGIYENIEADSISLWQTDTETRMSI